MGKRLGGKERRGGGGVWRKEVFCEIIFTSRLEIMGGSVLSFVGLVVSELE